MLLISYMSVDLGEYIYTEEYMTVPQKNSPQILNAEEKKTVDTSSTRKMHVFVDL